MMGRPAFALPPKHYASKVKTLSKLPMEILELIAFQVVAEFFSLAKGSSLDRLHGTQRQARIIAFENIKSVRLVCWNFAALQAPKRILFRRLKLYALPWYVDLLLKTRLDSMAPYITTIEFSAFPFGPTITKQEFIDRILATSPNAMNASQEHVDWSYLQFHQLAFKMRDLLEGYELHNLWAKSLKALPNVRHIEVESPIRVESENSLVRNVGIDYRPNILLDNLYFDDVVLMDSYPQVFQDEVARNGNILLATVVRCLAHASISPGTFIIRSEHTADFHWELIPEWAKLDLTNVVDLRYHGVYRKGGTHRRDAKASNHDSSLQALLCRVSSSVKSIELRNASRQAFTWHDHSQFLQPHLKFFWLRNFCLVDGYIDVYSFADFISKHDRLRGLYLEDVWPNNYDRGAWKVVFSALRQKLLQVEIFDAYVSREARESSGSTFSIRAVANATYDADSLNDTYCDKESGTKNFEKDLASYIEGKSKWTSVLEDKFFRDGDADMM